MWLIVINKITRTSRYYPLRVTAGLTPVVMRLDMIHIAQFCNPWYLVDILGVVVQVRIIRYPFDVSLEMSVVNRIETN